jgi:hypothetical protein
MKRIAIIGAVIVAAIMAMGTTAYAQTYTCIIINGVKCFVLLDPCGVPIGIFCPGGSNGTATFNSLNGPIPPAGPISTQLTPGSINVTVTEPSLGVITTKNDLSRTSSATTLKTNNGATRFPLTAAIRFFATAEISTRPGKLYKSKTELVFGSNNVTSVDPFVNENFRLLNSVDYYLDGDPNRNTAFTLQANTTVLTLGSNNNNNLE